MDLKEIRDKKSEDLQVRLRELAEELFRASCVSERLTPQKGAEIRKLRKEVARIKSVLRQRELSESVKAERETVDGLLRTASDDKKRIASSGTAKLRGRRQQLARVAHELELVKGK